MLELSVTELSLTETHRVVTREEHPDGRDGDVPGAVCRVRAEGPGPATAEAHPEGPHVPREALRGDYGNEHGNPRRVQQR